jgi:hypothetical protein
MIERVCVSCGFGLLVEAPGPIAPSPDDAFLVVNHELVIQSVGRRAEQLLNVRESFVVGRELTELLLPIDCERDGAGALSDAVFDAASGDPMPVIARLVLCRPVSPGCGYGRGSAAAVRRGRRCSCSSRSRASECTRCRPSNREARGRASASFQF